MKILSRTKFLPALIALLCLGTLSPFSSGQRWGMRGITEHFKSKVQVAGSRSAEQNLELAQKDLEAGEYERCVRRIQDSIDEYGARALSATNGRFVGIRSYCNQMIDNLPAEGQETYRRIYDPYAESLYKKSLATQDLKGIQEVYRRYSKTSFGQLALRASVSLSLEQGLFAGLIREALLYLEVFPAAEDRQEVIAALCLASRLTGDQERLQELLATLDADELAIKVLVGEQEQTLGDYIARCLKEVRGEFSDANEQASFRSRLFGSPQWEIEVKMHPRSSSPPDQRLDDFGIVPTPASYEFPWQPIEPLISEGSIFFSDGLSVHSYELYSKRERWRVLGSVKRSQARQNRAVDFPLTMDRGVLFAALETPRKPEKSIWTFVAEHQVPHRQLVAIDAADGEVLWNHYRFAEGSAEDRAFIARLNINSPPLIIGENIYVAASYFHTSYHQYIVCFDRRTGRKNWATFICTGQLEQNMFGNRVREAISGYVVEKDGILYHSTNIGVICAVDARLGTLRFTSEYEQIPIPRQTRFDNAIYERAPAWMNCPPVIVGEKVVFAPMDCNDLVVVDRRDGRLEKTGIRRDRHNRFRYICGPYKNKVIVLGSQMAFYDLVTGKVQNQPYKFESRHSSNPSLGQGFVARPSIVGNKLYAHVHDDRRDKICVWNLDTLKQEDFAQTLNRKARTAVGGNLSYRNGMMVSAATTKSGSKTYLRAYFDQAKVRANLQAAIKAAPRDPAPLYRLGEFSLQGATKDYDLALDAFQRALKLAEEGPLAHRSWVGMSRNALYRLCIEFTNARPRSQVNQTGTVEEYYEKAFLYANRDDLKVDILMRLMRRAWQQNNIEQVRAYHERLMKNFAHTPYDYEMLFPARLGAFPKARYPEAGLISTALMASFAKANGKPKLAVDYLQDVIRLYPENRIGAERAWDYAYRGINDLIRNHGKEVYGRHARAAQALFDESKSRVGIQGFETLKREYPNAPIISAAYLEITRRYIDSDRTEEALSGIQDFLWKFRKPSGEALSQYAQVLMKTEGKESARDLWLYLTQAGGAKFANPELLLRAKAALDELPALTRNQYYDLPSFGLELNPAWTNPTKGLGNSWALLNPRGTQPESMNEAFLAHDGVSLLCFDVHTGKPRWRIPVEYLKEDLMSWSGKNLILVKDTRLCCIDAQDGSELWKEGFDDESVTSIRCRLGKVITLVEKDRFTSLFRLEIRSALDGTVTGDKGLKGFPLTSNFAVSGRHILIPMTSISKTYIFDILTGQEPPSCKGGIDTGILIQPFFNLKGDIINMSLGKPGRDMEIYALDPLSGRKRWSRRIKPWNPKFHGHDESTLAVTMSSKPDEAKQLVILDVNDGKRLFASNLKRGQSVRGDIPMSARNAYPIFRSLPKQSGKSARFFCESLDFKASRNWRSIEFPSLNGLISKPFKEGVILKKIEGIRRSGRSRGKPKTTLYLISKTSGRIKAELELRTRRSTFEAGIRFCAGHLIIADGTQLKVFKQ